MSVSSQPATGVADNRLTPIPTPQIFSCGIGSSPAQTLFSSETAIPTIQLLSIPVGQPPATVQSFRFQPQLDATLFAKTLIPPERLKALSPRPSITRIQAPGDAIKLSDRLHYVLQPPLELMLARGSLEFPKQPFAYQLQGIAFLYPRFGALLADEMGLGKTMQAITAVRLLLFTGEVGRVLLVCPKPLVNNWVREFAQWAPEVPVSIIEGDPQRRAWQWQLPRYPVKIANYELMTRDAEMLADLQLQFDLVVLDEAQRIKNPNSATNDAICTLERSRSWALTGTPIENSLADLSGIFDFVSPGRLKAEMKPRAVNRAIGDFVLRRTKDKVLADLPPKLFRDAELELTAAQRETYSLAEKDGILRLTEMGDSATIQHVFELILRLKQICNFDTATGESSKLERLAADLEEIAASGQKAIVFSQWVDTLVRLHRELPNLNPLEYHGKIPMRQRDGIIDQFRGESHRHVMLMTYGAGGVGLNLQFCSYVFLFDRWWNPAVEDQAINRAHRIGVTGPVTITRFLTVDTIEQRINQVLTEKRELFESIFTENARQPKLGLTQQEIFGLFKLRSPQGKLQAAMPEIEAA
jgi:SNF2 family DNA or RNA helicase